MSEAEVKIILEKNPFYIKKIKQTPELCMLAVRTDGLTLWDIEDQTMEICLAAVENQPQAIFYIRDKALEEVIRLAYSFSDRILPEDTEENLRRAYMCSNKAILKRELMNEVTQDQVDLILVTSDPFPDTACKANT